MISTLISAENVCKQYGTGTSAVSALQGISFQVLRGERVALLGKSGSGKSTLMNLIGGLDVPTSGTLTIAERRLDQLSRPQLADFRLACIGFVFQSFHLIANKTVRENVELPLMLAGIATTNRRKQAESMLESVGLQHRLQHHPAELSGGERQRVAIARALINRPAILLADEPTGNLDTANASSVMELILEQVRTLGTTLLLVTHDPELAARTTDRAVHLQDGAILAET